MPLGRVVPSYTPKFRQVDRGALGQELVSAHGVAAAVGGERRRGSERVANVLDQFIEAVGLEVA